VPHAAPVPPAAPAAEQIALPEWGGPETSEQSEGASVLEDESAFNFGIYAASGSGIIVESTVPDSTQLTTSTSPSVAESKAGKKGLLQMLGWGKKKAAPTAASAAPVLAPANNHPGTAAIAAPEVGFVPPDLELPEETHVAEPQVGHQATPPDDESLQSFFNQFK
jgi:hypothetical protein